ncbi:MAG: non-hydrolyzing UDP-N-acetylglucosamine 2-epimerase [Halobacteriota archaeon]
MKILSVVGARPQFVKAFPVSRALRVADEEVIVHTGQHYDYELSRVFFDELDIPEPAHNLGVGSSTHGEQTARVMSTFEPVLEREDPDAVIVYGDTNSTLGAALVAAKSEHLLAHVEAGLRSNNRSMPEEHNRVLTDHAADLLLAPTDAAVDNLTREGLAERTVLTGDVMLDALLWAREAAERRVSLLEELDLELHEYLLLTVHRAANTDDPRRLEAIIDTMLDRPERVIFPIHPRTEAALRSMGSLDRVERGMTVLEPVSYLEFIQLVSNAAVAVTDSGGVQKEAFLLETPCVTLREETEWTETVEAGWNVLVGAEPRRIHAAIDRVRSSVNSDGKPRPYGDGSAGPAIVDAIRAAVQEGRTPVGHATGR